MNCRMTIAAGLIASAGLLSAPAARAAFIVDQPATAGIGLVSTAYTLTPLNSVLEIDSFGTAVPYHLGTLTAFSSSDGGGVPISVTASIYSGGPPGGPGATLVATATGSLDGVHDIVVDFRGTVLPTGTYYLTASVLRQLPIDGIWHWNTTFSGPQALTWPIGMGGRPAPETSPFTNQPLALAYTLTGTPVVAALPEPSSLGLLGGGLLLTGALIAGRKR